MPGNFCEPHFGALLDEAERFRREGNEIHILVSNGVFDIGVANNSRNLEVCTFCARYTNKIINKVSKDFCIHEITEYLREPIKNRKFKYDSVAGIKKIKYKGAKIGFACLSTYISKTRNLEPIINNEFRHDLDCLLLQSSILTDAIGNALNKIKPELVYLYNGRFFDSRPVYDVARQNNINTRCMDVIEHAGKIFVKQISNNATRHNIKENISQMNYYWDLQDIPVKDKIRITHDYFQNKREGLYTSGNVFVKSQKKGLLPDGFDKNKQNIVIFNTSEDEYAAIDNEYDNLLLFKSQREALAYIFKTFKDNKKIHFYLRLHPNLSGIKYKYHTDLYLFAKKYSNVTVIPPDDKVSTYGLLDAAEKVIVFGSAMGVEAAYWNKPVMLLSGAIYYYLDICYKPKNRLELKKMIVSKLKLKKKTDTLKYAYFIMHEDPDRLHKYVDFTEDCFNFLGWQFATYNYKSILGSPKLFALHQAVMGKLYGHFRKHRIKF